MANRLIGKVRTIRTDDRKARILAAIADGCTLSEAAKRAGCARNALWEWRRDDAAFRAEFEAAYDAGTDVYIQEAKRRAFDEKSDVLLIFLMKARAPHVFNRKMLEPAAPTTVNVAVNNDVVHFYLPDNHRHEPPATIDGEAIPPEVQERLKAAMAPPPSATLRRCACAAQHHAPGLSGPNLVLLASPGHPDGLSASQRNVLRSLQRMAARTG